MRTNVNVCVRCECTPVCVPSVSCMRNSNILWKREKSYGVVTLSEPQTPYHIDNNSQPSAYWLNTKIGMLEPRHGTSLVQNPICGSERDEEREAWMVGFVVIELYSFLYVQYARMIPLRMAKQKKTNRLKREKGEYNVRLCCHLTCSIL